MMLIKKQIYEKVSIDDWNRLVDELNRLSNFTISKGTKPCIRKHFGGIELVVGGTTETQSSGGSTIYIGEVAYGSEGNDTDTLDVIFDPPVGSDWDYTKNDYQADDVAKAADDDEDVYDWVAKEGYTWPVSELDAWDDEKTDYAEGDKVKDGDPLLGYIAKEGYTYPTNPYDPETQPTEYAAWTVPHPADDTTNWDVWTDYAPPVDTDNWEKKAVPVKCIIYGTEALDEAVPFFLAKDKIMAVNIGGIIYFNGYCQKWGACP